MSFITLVGVSTTLGANDIILEIKITFSCENFFIIEHHVCHFMGFDILPDLYAAQFSYWFLILLQFLNINFSIAFLSEIFSQYSSDSSKITFKVFRHCLYTFLSNLIIKPLFNEINETFCTSFFLVFLTLA